MNRLFVLISVLVCSSCLGQNLNQTTLSDSTILKVGDTIVLSTKTPEFLAVTIIAKKPQHLYSLQGQLLKIVKLQKSGSKKRGYHTTATATTGGSEGRNFEIDLETAATLGEFCTLQKYNDYLKKAAQKKQELRQL